jgi:pimeloyl-ACP methyl ester carboxylesterase
MARFVLIHGAFSGAWIWEPLIRELEAAGHTAEAFDLPGSCDDSTPVEEVTLDRCADRICAALAAGEEPAVLVASSGGGIAATQAAARYPERVATLIYVGSFIPQDGQSLIGLTELPEGEGDQVQANMVVEGDPPVGRMPGDAARKYVYEDSSDEVASWAIERETPQALAPFAEPVSIPEGALDDVPRGYVLTKRDKCIPPALQRRMIEEACCEQVVELDTDHIPQLSATAKLAEALDRLAVRT